MGRAECIGVQGGFGRSHYESTREFTDGGVTVYDFSGRGSRDEAIPPEMTSSRTATPFGVHPLPPAPGPQARVFALFAFFTVLASR